MAAVGRDATREIHRAVVDGVPVFWADLDAPYMGALVFRVGFADETLPTSGMTHLVEHLALWQFAGDQPYEYNGMVEPHRTIFYASGTGEQVGEFLSLTAAALAEPPVEKIDVERRILGTEEEGGGAGLVTFHRWLRYGATGHGLSYYRALGLRRADADGVAAWSRRYFNGGNAAVWLSGPPPEGLTLRLPHGERQAPAEAIVTPHAFPVFFHDDARDLVGLSARGRAGAALPAAIRIAGRRVRRQLRYELGVSYDVGHDVDVVDAETRVHFLWADCLGENAQTCLDEMLAIVARLAEEGPTEEELATEAERSRAMLADPDAVRGHLDFCVEAELLGRPQRSPEELVEEDEALTAEAVAAALRTALETAIVSAPEGTKRPEWLNPPGDHGGEIEGETFWERRRLWERRKRGRLVVGADGVAWVTPDGEINAAERDQIVAVGLLDDGAFSVRRSCGCFIDVSPGEIDDFERARELVLQLVPEDLVIPPS